MDHELSPSGLYRVEVDDLELTQAPVLVHTLHGSLDAGGVGSLVASHLLDSLPAQRVVTFLADELIDYRSRRPPMLFEDFAYTDYEEPVLAIDLLRDDEGRPLLVLHGPEPDLRWDAFVSDVAELVERLGVERTIGVHGMPGPVPHTRPVAVTTHGSALEKLEENRGVMIGKIQVPGSASGLLEFRLGEAGHPATGLSVTVPHYLAQNQYPPAAAEAVRWIARAGDLSLPVGELEAASASMQEQIAAHVQGSPEVAAVVEALERQYDQYAQVADPAARERSLTAGRPQVPTADEIGAEAEAFLAAELRAAMGQGPVREDAGGDAGKSAADTPAGPADAASPGGETGSGGPSAGGSADGAADGSADGAAQERPGRDDEGDGRAPQAGPADDPGAGGGQDGPGGGPPRFRWPWQR